MLVTRKRLVGEDIFAAALRRGTWTGGRSIQHGIGQLTRERLEISRIIGVYVGTGIDRACLRAIRPALINRHRAGMFCVYEKEREREPAGAKTSEKSPGDLHAKTCCCVSPLVSSLIFCASRRAAPSICLPYLFLPAKTKTAVRGAKEEGEEGGEEREVFAVQRKLTARCTYAHGEAAGVTVWNARSLRYYVMQTGEDCNVISTILATRRSDAKREDASERRDFSGGSWKFLPEHRVCMEEARG